MLSPLLVHLPRGAELPAELSSSKLPEAWVQATGHVEEVELKLAGEGADRTRALRGRLNLLSLSGPVAGPFTVTLARATDAGIELLGGELVRARSDGVTAALFPTQEGAPRATEQEASEKPGARGGERRSERRRVAASADSRVAAPNDTVSSSGDDEASGSWADRAVEAAEERADQEVIEDREDALPQPNDRVDHFAFGLCDVLMAEDERLKIRDVHGPGRIRDISIEKLKVSPPQRIDGKRVFKLSRKN